MGEVYCTVTRWGTCRWQGDGHRGAVIPGQAAAATAARVRFDLHGQLCYAPAQVALPRVCAGGEGVQGRHRGDATAAGDA